MMILIIPVFVEFAIEMDFNSLIELGNKPYLTAGESVIGKFCLPALFHFLSENAVFIAD